MLKQIFCDKVKHMELPKTYIPNDHEEEINRLWLESGFFNPDNVKAGKDAKPYTIILPPPNVTDRLHLGHASMLAIQDLLIRFHRLQGFKTLWVPGTDHASIATQAVLEKKIYKEEGKTRHDIGRTEFLRRVMDFALENQTTILDQIKTFGASLDWSRLAFTLDDKRQTAVRQMFVNMYEAGAIYRGERIVNWCPHCQSTLADDEVEYKEEKAKFYYLKYGPVIIATVRPETKFADKVIIVHPEDDRYKHLIGQRFIVPWIEGDIETQVISDESADPSLGTGAMTITPAHSFVDFELAQKYNLEIKKIIDEQGNFIEAAGSFAGKNARESRDEIVAILEKKGLIDHIDEDYVHNLSVCYRCGTAIEPLPSKQWFVAVGKPLEKFSGKSLKEKALEVSEQNQITFVPNRFKKRYEDWMKNLHDWCISRQIWFGHSIPVWYRDEEIYVGVEAPVGEGWQQDSDTLDTWFSSGMWTFSTLGWPEKTKDLEVFHPTHVLETGYEIITLWVSRMIMMSLFALGEIPFEQVYLHGMVLDAEGKKMSKSKGNGIDPVEVSKKYGTDAVRLALLLGSTPGVDTRLNEEKIASFRNFTNKLWNISRYILSQEVDKKEEALSLADRWIQSRLQKTCFFVLKKIRDLDFASAGEDLRSFTLDDLADWYVEVTKFEKGNSATLLPEILETILKLWHPFMPFVTETIWQEWKQDSSLLMVAEWPVADTFSIDQTSEDQFEIIRGVIRSIRNLRSEHRLEPSQKVTARLYTEKYATLLEGAKSLIQNLRTGIAEIKILRSGEKPKNALLTVIDDIEIYLEVEIDIKIEGDRLKKEITETERVIQSLAQTLSNEEFILKAPEAIVLKEKEKLNDLKLKLEKLSTQLKSL